MLAIPVEELVLHYVSLCTPENSAVQECHLLLLLFHWRVRLQEFPVPGVANDSVSGHSGVKESACVLVYFTLRPHSTIQFYSLPKFYQRKKTFMKPQIDI